MKRTVIEPEDRDPVSPPCGVCSDLSDVFCAECGRHFVEDLLAETERLRAALREIAGLVDDGGVHVYGLWRGEVWLSAVDIARGALRASAPGQPGQETT